MKEQRKATQEDLKKSWARAMNVSKQLSKASPFDVIIIQKARDEQILGFNR